MNKVLNLAVSMSLLSITASQTFAASPASLDGTVAFIGTGNFEPNQKFQGLSQNLKATLSLSYMTAKEMQRKVASITGFYHRDFDTYADVLGRWDPRSGTRTADRPSLVSFLFIKKISANVASAVIARETFLDPDERVVFRNTDLDRAPTDMELDNTISEIYQNWLRLPIDADILLNLNQEFRQQESQSGFVQAYKSLVEALLQHGAIYYY